MALLALVVVETCSKDRPPPTNVRKWMLGGGPDFQLSSPTTCRILLTDVRGFDQVGRILATEFETEDMNIANMTGWLCTSFDENHLVTSPPSSFGGMDS